VSVPAAHVYALGAALFAFGLAGFIMRRNLLVVLLSLELMFNGALVTLVGAAREHRDPEPSTFGLFVVFLAAVEVSVGLALVIALFRLRQTLDPDAAAELRG
jgi:NADH-quinone oxidoreductase subunit K